MNHKKHKPQLKNDKMNSIKIKNFCSSEVERMERQVKYWKKIFTEHLSEEGLHPYFLYLNNKTTWFFLMGKILREISSKRTNRWQIHDGSMLPVIREV